MRFRWGFNKTKTELERLQHLLFKLHFYKKNVAVHISNMNFSMQPNKPPSGLLYAGFNQDGKCLNLGTTTGIEVLNLDVMPPNPQAMHETIRTIPGGVSIIERFYSSSLLVYVRVDLPRRCCVSHLAKTGEIIGTNLHDSIRSIQMNRKVVVTAEEDTLSIFEIFKVTLLHKISDLPPNPDGIFALSTQTERDGRFYVAYPGHHEIGEVLLYDACNLRAAGMIPAHNGKIQALKFSLDGKMLATASTKGTVIRVFSVPDGKRLFEFRRGVARNAEITCLAFGPSGNYLAASSTHETVHIFKLEQDENEKPKEEKVQGMLGWLTETVKHSATYLPDSMQQMTDVFTHRRDFATARLPPTTSSEKLKTICSIKKYDEKYFVLVVREDTKMFVYSLNTNEGGECALDQVIELLKDTEEEPQLDATPKKAADSPPKPVSPSPPKVPSNSEPKSIRDSPKEAGLNAIGELRLDDEVEFPPVKN